MGLVVSLSVAVLIGWAIALVYYRNTTAGKSDACTSDFLSDDLETRLGVVYQAAKAARHMFLTVDHLLLAVLGAPRVIEILSAQGCDIGSLNKNSRGIWMWKCHAPKKEKCTNCNQQLASGA